MDKIQKLKELRIGAFVNSVVGGIIYFVLSIAGIATGSVGYIASENFGRHDLIVWFIAFMAIGLLLFILSIAEFVDMIRSLNIKDLVFTAKGVKKDILLDKVKKMKANENTITFFSLLVLAAIGGTIYATVKTGFWFLVLFMIPALFVSVISIILAACARSQAKKAVAAVS